MELDSLEVLPLHHYEMYSEACCDLINSEWKRSHSARMISLQKSCDSFPTSLVMVYKKTVVVGHSKLTLIPAIPDACFVESVVIDKEYRGRGWGKFLMLATEDYARTCCLQEIYLSALDSVPEFYKKLGYEPCETVSIYGGPLASPRASPATVRPSEPPLPNYIVYNNSRVLKTYMRKPLYCDLDYYKA